MLRDYVKRCDADNIQSKVLCKRYALLAKKVELKKKKKKKKKKLWKKKKKKRKKKKRK